MDEQFRALLTDELDTQAEPPIGDLVETAVARGRRTRVARRLGFGGIGVMVLAVAVGTVAVLPRPTHAVPVGAPAQTVPATPAGILQLLTEQLPAGTTSGYAGSDTDGELMVQVYLDSGQGPGMLRVTVDTASDDPWLAPGGKAIVGAPVTLADGTRYQVTQMPDNCVQSTMVIVVRPNRAMVVLNIATCLAWNGTANPASPAPLTVAQAVAVADSPRWGVKIDKALVDAGRQRFPHLPPVR